MSDTNALAGIDYGAASPLSGPIYAELVARLNKELDDPLWTGEALVAFRQDVRDARNAIIDLERLLAEAVGALWNDHKSHWKGDFATGRCITPYCDGCTALARIKAAGYGGKEEGT